ncbi:hypothetical protein C453_18630 [Haloferax elongans ATCC BAA-1513]|uniref:Uncharacterized protein n=1 Tax=Haloferax elongans ATCC BAA-1513 TaxID=1230453 RepID=M0H8W7_HALEO|nr:hypothetical protein [Haloferax elongans]ELZ80981.1 hypothetical protein C453_18630 [Haloferax elongans ATCC BAA-1513]
MTDTTDNPTVTLRGDDRTVSLTRELTPAGERLRLETDDDSIRLDALALESLTWQEDEFFTELTGVEYAPGENPVSTDETLQIGNEYTVVQLTVFDTDDGPRLEIDSPKLGYSCRLGVAELVALSRKDMSLFSDLLHTPMGPVDDHDDDPLFH